MPIFWIYYAVKELNMNRALGVTLGLLQLLSNILLAYFAYVNILNSSYNLIGSFIMYFLGFLGMSIIPSLIGYLAVNETGRKYIKSGLWLIGLILATYVMSFIGNFGLLSSPIVPFPYDTILVVIIGLVFHYLAVYSGFRTEEIENIVREQAQQD
ncbi:hypothetical protein [Sulfolobus acidocaldarius]|uniref:hypothetical protein n=1 Tax=Sulfolobus acidocaldarius TaxID=2285 RepID=UPI001E564972|nr:hypothetical protein [Sulfolobus acidocaldarius]